VVSNGRYHSPLRTDLAAATRTAILDCARELYINRGYNNVTVAQIAAAAGVAVQTVYASTGGKAEIMRDLLIPAIQTPEAEQTLMTVRGIHDARQVIDTAARGTRAAHEAHWDMLEALVPECRTEPAAAAVLEAGNAEYLAALTIIGNRIIELGPLREDVDPARVPDLLWFYIGQDAWFSLVSHRRWSFDNAERWLATQAKRALLA
jgi:AcrR family transcriptional regulator